MPQAHSKVLVKKLGLTELNVPRASLRRSWGAPLSLGSCFLREPALQHTQCLTLFLRSSRYLLGTICNKVKADGEIPGIRNHWRDKSLGMSVMESLAWVN